MDLDSEAPEYKVSARTNDNHEAIAKTGTALAALVDEALLSHEPHEIDEECEFEEFARDLLRVLTSHSDALASSEEADTDVSLFYQAANCIYPAKFFHYRVSILFCE